MKKGYQGIENSLMYLLDISYDYDGCGDNVKELHELIDEMRDVCCKALKYKDKFYIPMYSGEDIEREENNKNLKNIDEKNK
jgi:hypothetical protein